MRKSGILTVVKQTTYTNTTTYRPNGGRRIVEELVVRSRGPKKLTPSRSPSPALVLESGLRQSRAPHPFYEEHPQRRRSYERERVTVRRQRSRSTVHFARGRTPSPRLRIRTPSPIRGIWEDNDSDSGPARRERTPVQRRIRQRSKSRSRSRKRSRSRRRSGSRSGQNDDAFIKGALAASVTALAINRARNLMEDSDRRESSRKRPERRKSRARRGSRSRSRSRERYLMSGGLRQ